MRTLIPAETLVYLETNDLAAALQPIVDAKPFMEVAKSKPDFSALKGVQLAVAVTGFETSEEKLTDEHSVGRVQPHFVAVADTHAWNYQANAFAEQKLGGFVANIYDSEPTLEKSDKNGGKYFKWTAPDGRKAFALVDGSLIYFGNDESAIDKCLAVKRGESDSIAKSAKVKPAAPETLASGYVSTDGVVQIAGLIGVKFASEATDESEAQSAIAGIVPTIIRSTITDVTWTMAKGEHGIEDKYQIGMPADIANVFTETMAPSGTKSDMVSKSLKSEFTSVTSYDLKDPLAAWNSVRESIQKQLDPSANRILDAISPLAFEEFGIKDEKLFLSSVGPTIRTATGGKNGDNHYIHADVKSADGVTRSIIGPLTKKRFEVHGVGEALFSDDDEFVAQFYENTIRFGDKSMIIRDGRDIMFETQIERLIANSWPATSYTFSADSNEVQSICEMLSSCPDNASLKILIYTETRFTKTGIERRTVSDFGLFGSIIAQLGEN